MKNKKITTLIGLCFIPLLLMSPILAVAETAEPEESWGVETGEEIIFTMGTNLELEVPEDLWDALNEMFANMFEAEEPEEVDFESIIGEIFPLVFNIKYSITDMDNSVDEVDGDIIDQWDSVEAAVQMKLPEAEEWGTYEQLLDAIVEKIDIDEYLGGIEASEFLGMFMGFAPSETETIGRWYQSYGVYNETTDEYDMYDELDLMDRNLGSVISMESILIPTDANLGQMLQTLIDAEDFEIDEEAPDFVQEAESMQEVIEMLGLYDLNMQAKSLGAKFSFDRVAEEVIDYFLEMEGYENGEEPAIDDIVDLETLELAGEALIRYDDQGILIEQKVSASGSMDLTIPDFEDPEADPIEESVSFSMTQRLFRGERDSIDAPAEGDRGAFLEEIPGYPVAIVGFMSAIGIIALVKKAKKLE